MRKLRTRFACTWYVLNFTLNFEDNVRGCMTFSRKNKEKSKMFQVPDYTTLSTSSPRFARTLHAARANTRNYTVLRPYSILKVSKKTRFARQSLIATALIERKLHITRALTLLALHVLCYQKTTEDGLYSQTRLACRNSLFKQVALLRFTIFLIIP